MTDLTPNDRISSSAIARLHDYSSEFNDRILNEARRLNPDDVITSRDIVDAYAHLEDSKFTYRGESRTSGLTTSRSTSLAMIYSAIAGLLALSTALILILSPSIPTDTRVLTYVAAFMAYLAALLSFTWVFVTWMRARRARSQAVRYAELGARDSDLAYYVAEAMQSTRGGKREDGTFQTVRFIAKWARLEDRLRRLATVALGMPEQIASDYPIGPLLGDLADLGILDPTDGEEFMQILDVRNRLAHGDRASDAETQVGLDYMDVLEEILDENIHNHSRRK